MLLMRYEEYKKCDCGWLDKIPSGWSTIPIKRTVKNILTSFIDGDWIESNVITSDGIRYLTTGNVGALEYKEQGNGHISEETFKDLNCSEVFPGDMLISRLNEPIGRTCIVPNIGNRIVVAVDNVIYRPDENKYDKRYLMYQMNCLPYTENANYIARGSTMSRISRTMLGSIKLCIPTLQEQQAIACYLNEKCGKINDAIDVQKKKIDLLNEFKQTIITNAVTKGLNPNAPMKDSGVEWIGQVPEHWEVMKTSLAFLGIGSGTTPSTSRKEYYTEEDGLYWLQTGDLNDGEITDTSKKITSLAADECNLKFYPTDSVVIAMYGATIGKVGLLKISTSTNQACCVLPKSKRCIPAFAFYLFIGAKKQLLIDAMGGGQPNISQDIIKKLKVSIPPISEQRTIVDHIAVEVSKIDAQISKANRRIELLNELKQSIITEAVTGKRKVI